MANPQALLAVQRLEATGNLEAAFRGFLDLGRKGDAARVAQRLGRVADAVRLYTEAGLPYEAAGVSYQAGDFAAALDQLTFVPREHPHYRAACVHAIHLSAKLDRFEYGLENMLAEFLSTPAASESEVQALLVLSTLYERRNMAESAVDALDRILEAVPQHPAATAAKARLAKAAAVAPAEGLDQDAAFFGRAGEKRPATLPPDALVPAPVEPPIAVGSGRETLFEAGKAGGAPAASKAVPTVVTIAGRYRLEGRIGVGGMAEVWRATDLDVGEEIALKLFQPLSDPSLEERIKAELKLTRKLAHPNVVRIYDIGTHEGRRYISMELLRGQDLQGVPKPVAPAKAVEWLAQAAEGLQIAHDMGVIHRDVKPENLFLTEEGRVKVMDFGIAKDNEVRRTRAGMMAGTPEFMSPEQINDMSQVTPATDIYSLGIVAYELLTGRLPFMHKELMPLLMMHAKDAPPPLRRSRPELSEAMERAVLQALEKSPASRPATARAFADALRAAL